MFKLLYYPECSARRVKQWFNGALVLTCGLARYEVVKDAKQVTNNCATLLRNGDCPLHKCWIEDGDETDGDAETGQGAY